MATMLTKSQSARVRMLREMERSLNTGDWMCEGADDNMLVFFSNEREKMFYADYYGNVENSPLEVSGDLAKLVELEGKIAQICYA